MQEKLEYHREDLIYYLLFLRITPLVPNFFINISSPHLKVPLWKFFLATLLGLMPLNVVHIKTGLMLNEVTAVGADLKVSICFSRNWCLIRPS